MPTEELMALAGTAAATLVAAMTTDAWQNVRSRFVSLFSRASADRQAATEFQLDSNAKLLARAPDSSRARQGLAGIWQLELESLLDQYPEAAGDLRALLAQLGRDVAARPQPNLQANVARDGGTVYAVQHGSLIMHDATPARDHSAPLIAETSDADTQDGAARG